MFMAIYGGSHLRKREEGRSIPCGVERVPDPGTARTIQEDRKQSRCGRHAVKPLSGWQATQAAPAKWRGGEAH